MSITLDYTNKEGDHTTVVVDKRPDTCPACGRGIEPILKVSYGGMTEQGFLHVQSVYLCPRNECRSLFIADYKSILSRSTRRAGEFAFLRDVVIRGYENEEPIQEEIEELSPRFKEVYSQANFAYNANLTEITGPGYRKSLEILLKDFLSHINPEESERYKSMWLGDLINNEIDDDKIKALAKLAKKVGNDETHYIKTLEHLNVNDLRKLIQLTRHWIAYVISTNSYIDSEDEE